MTIFAVERKGEPMSRIDRQSAIEAVHKAIFDFFDICGDDEESPMTYLDNKLLEVNKAITARIKNLPSAQPEPPEAEELDFVQQHKKIGVQLEIGRAEIIRCKECKHFHYDMPYVIQGVPVLGHEVCDAWGDGCKTGENGYCFLAERRTDG